MIAAPAHAKQFEPTLLLVQEELEHVPIARRHPLQSVSTDFKNLQVSQHALPCARQASPDGPRTPSNF